MQSIPGCGLLVQLAAAGLLDEARPAGFPDLPQQRGQHVDQRNGRCDARRLMPRHAHHQRHVQLLAMDVAVACHAVLTQTLAVVAEQDECRRFPQIQSLHPVEQSPDLPIDVADLAVVGVDGVA